MPETFASTVVAAKNDLRQTSAFLWTAQIDVDGTNSIAVVDSDAPVTVGGVVYSPFPFRVEEVPIEGDGSLPEIRVTVSNIGGEVATRLESGGMLDRTCVISQVWRGDTANPLRSETFIVQGVTISLDTATFVLGLYFIFDATFPARRQHRTRCDKVFGSADCGYTSGLTNLISGTYPSFSTTTCDLTLNGGNGCIAHGANETANGSAKLHPARFGGFAGIPKGPAKL